MKKILILSSSFKFYDTFLKPIEKTLLNKNNEVYVLTNFPKSTNIKNIKRYKSIRISRKIKIIDDLISILHFLFYLAVINPKLIITSTPKGAIFGIVSKLLFFWKRRIHIYTGVTWSNKSGIKKNLLKTIDRINFIFSNEIFFDGLNQINFFKDNNFNIQKCKLISNGSIKGVDTNKFYSNLNTYIDFRRKNSLNNNDKILLYMGRIDKEKGIVFLIDCFEEIYSKYKNIILVICGSLEIDLINIVKKKDINIYNRIFIINHTDEPEKIFQVADILCLPSEREGFGNVVIEASSCCLPVVGSDINGLKDSLIENVNGLKYRLNDKNNFISIILNLLNDSNLRINLGKKGREFILQKFKEDKVLSDLSDMIESNL